MPEFRLIGKDFTPPDLYAKVTGTARYSEDFRVEGMLFAKLFLSPMPHARVRRIDASEALKIPGVHAVLTPDEVPKVQPPNQPALASEPLYVGDPIVAVAAESESIAAEAVERLRVDLQPLPFVLDPLDSLRPGGPNARPEGNVVPSGGSGEGVQGARVTTIKWTARDFIEAGEGRLPMGKAPVEWSYGDLEAGFREAAYILDETVVTQNLAHHCMEPRSMLAYWSNGKLFLHGSSQSVGFVVPYIANLMGLSLDQVVLIAEYCGGGFGSKGSGYVQWAIPALLARKTGRPVMLRVSRAEEFYYGKGRPGFQLRARIGFRKDGRITAMDLFIVQDNGAYEGFPDAENALAAASLVYQPLAMRARAIRVFTNTPPRSPQRGPGENQIAMALEPLIDQAAKALGIDRVEIRRINAPGHDARFGAARTPVTSSYFREALAKGAEMFQWDKQVKLSGQRNGSKVTGVGVGTAYHSAGSSGFDGLVVIRPDGKLYVHNGTGNLGTFSYAATARAAAEALGMPWEQTVVYWGDTRRGVPWNLGQFGSNTSYTMTRTNWAAAMDAKRKLQEIAARDLGGSPDDYDTRDGRVFHKANPSRFLTFAQAARRAIELGGKYSGQELPDNLHPLTVIAARQVAGQGLVGVAKDTMPRTGTPPAFAAAFARVEVDVETGHVEIKEFVAVEDCGRVIHPASLATQIRGGSVQGFGLALHESYLYDRQYGVPLDVGLHGRKIPTYLDIPLQMRVAGVDLPDPQNPVGARGAGEPPMGAAAAAVACAVADAVGVFFKRTPISPAMILNAVNKKPQPFGPLEVNVV